MLEENTARLRFRQAFADLVEHVKGATLAPPAPRDKIAQLIDEAGALPPELETYFAICNGVEAGDERLMSVENVLRIDTPGFFAIAEDGCGNYDLVARDLAVGGGAVVFYDHERGRPDYLVASSLSAYVDVWVRRVIAAAQGKPDPARGTLVFGEAPAGALPFPFNHPFMQQHDPDATRLLKDRRFVEQLGDGATPLDLQHVVRDGSGTSVTRRSPFTGEDVVFPAPPTQRRRK